MLTDYALNFQDLASRALMLADDPEGERWSSEDVNECVNNAMLDVALDTQLILEKLTVQLQANQHLYNLHERIKTAGLRPFGFPVRIVYNLTTDPAARPIATSEYDLAGVVFIETGGITAWRIDLFDHGELALTPTPDADGSALPALTGNVQITYVALPTKMATPTASLDTLQAQYHETVSVRAAEMLLEYGSEEDLAVANIMESEYDALQRNIVGDQYRNMTPYDSLRVM